MDVNIIIAGQVKYINIKNADVINEMKRSDKIGTNKSIIIIHDHTNKKKK